MPRTKVFAISGFSKSGKTTLMASVVSELKRRGFSVIAVKHTHQNILPPIGTDTRTQLDAGADCTVLLGPEMMTIARPSVGISQIPRTCDADFMIIEGMKYADIPRIWCMSMDEDVPTEVKNIEAFVTREDGDLPQKIHGFRVLRSNDVRSVVELILHRAIPIESINE